MKRILTLGLALLMLILAGCSTEVTEYRQQPALDIFHYFQGRTEAAECSENAGDNQGCC